MERHQPLQRDITLQDVQYIAHLEIVDRHLEVADAVRREQPVREDASRLLVSQLEVLHSNAGRARLNRRWMSRLPHRGVESQLHVREAQLAVIGPEDVVSLYSVIALI